MGVRSFVVGRREKSTKTPVKTRCTAPDPDVRTPTKKPDHSKVYHESVQTTKPLCHPSDPSLPFDTTDPDRRVQ